MSNIEGEYSVELKPSTTHLSVNLFAFTYLKLIHSTYGFITIITFTLYLPRVNSFTSFAQFIFVYSGSKFTMRHSNDYHTPVHNNATTFYAIYHHRVLVNNIQNMHKTNL